MSTFKLKGQVIVNVYTEIEANTREEAIAIAKERELMSITNDSWYTEAEIWMADKMDGGVMEIKEA